MPRQIQQQETTGQRMTFSMEITKAIYREAIDGQARDDEPAAWWDAVAREMQAVVFAPSDREAAAVIAWWHNDWSSVSDTAVATARRIRRAARALNATARVRS